MGTPAIGADKGNQDFAFSIERHVDGVPWLLAGVADGASQSTWAARGARHASAAFIEAFDEFANEPIRDHADLASGETWAQLVAEAFHGSLRRRLFGDYHYLLTERFVDPTWDPELYRRQFMPASQDKNIDSWFQSTLLAVALGPLGGFGIFLGDGFYRADRFSGKERDCQEGHPDSTPANFRMLRKHVEVTRIPSRGASELGVLLATDGISKTPDEVLRNAMSQCGIGAARAGETALRLLEPRSNEDCERFLETLSRSTGVEQDNLSLAFACRRVD